MPRRGLDIQLAMPAKKKAKLLEEPPPSLDASFYDDEALPPGIVFSDCQQKKWRIGKPIGRGSFGRIYLASDDVCNEVTKANARYVVKIEPHTNGPLFVEVHCLVRIAQVDKIKTWRQNNKQKRLGMPVYIASGSFTEENSGVKYRFLVLPRYDIDLQKIIARTKVLDLKNVLVLAVQILDALEYLHDQGYTHSDIKSSNLMLGFDAGKLNKKPASKSAPSFQKETKEVAVLSGKHRRAKSTRGRTSNYYDDEDFIVDEKGDISEDEDVANVKKKLRRMLSDRDSRTMHRHHAFNLRQLSNYVNYEDMNSSICSDQSYQKLLDDYGSKSFIRTSEEFYDSIKNEVTTSDTDLNQIYKEAVLSQSSGQIYLLDYGLASKFVDSEGNHKDFGMDARKAHDGTLEYSSRDSHIGAHSRRSDLETLGYNLLDWLTGTLPWKTTEVLAEPDLVHAIKKNYMSDIKSFLKTCFKTEFYPQFMEKYLEYVVSLEFTEKPDYDYCRRLFKSELLANGYSKDMCLNFAELPMPQMNRKLFGKRFGKKNTPVDFLARNGIKKPYERENVCSLENNLKLELLKQTLNSSSDGFRKPCASRNFFISDADLVARLKKSLMPHDVFGKKLSPKNLRSNKKNITKRRVGRRHRNSIGKFGNFLGSARQFTWAEILARNPEDIIRKERNTGTKSDEEEDFDEETCKFKIRTRSDSSETSDTYIQSPLLQIDYLESMNPTYAMKEVFTKFNNKVSGKTSKELEEDAEGLEGYTPAMVKVYRMKERRQAKEKLELLKQQFSSKEPVVVLPRFTRSKRVASKQPVTRRSTRKKISESSSDADSTHQNADSTRTTRQKSSSESQHEKTEKTARKTRKTSDDSDSGKVTKPTRAVKKTRQQASLRTEKETKNLETECVSKNTRQKHSNVQKSDVDETVIQKRETRHTKKVDKIVETKQTSTRCTKSPPSTRSTLSASNRMKLRSSVRTRKL